MNRIKKLEILKRIEKLEKRNLKNFFNKTEYDHDGDRWYFPQLLQAFSLVVEKKLATADEILNYLFATFDFFNVPEDFVRKIIGYDRLELCIKESPVVFKQALLSKIYEFVEQNKTIDIGLHSHRYLNDQIRVIDAIKKIEKDLLLVNIMAIAEVAKIAS